MKEETKRCSTCCLVKPVTEFSWRKRRHDYEPQCKECINRVVRARRERTRIAPKIKVRNCRECGEEFVIPPRVTNKRVCGRRECILSRERKKTAKYREKIRQQRRRHSAKVRSQSEDYTAKATIRKRRQRENPEFRQKEREQQATPERRAQRAEATRRRRAWARVRAYLKAKGIVVRPGEDEDDQ